MAAYLIDPARRRYPLDELVAGGEHRGRRRKTRWRARRMEVRALWEDQQPEVDRLELRGLLEEIELPLVEVLYRLERQGVKLDTYLLGETAARVADEIEELEHRIWELAGEEFTIGSPQQLSQILFEKLELSRKRRGKTGFSTDARVLRAIRGEHEIIPLVEKWRELSKLKSTYLDSLPDADLRGDRPAAHDVQPDGDHDRPAVEHRPEPAEHPDPDGAGPPDPPLPSSPRRAAA